MRFRGSASSSSETTWSVIVALELLLVIGILLLDVWRTPALDLVEVARKEKDLIHSHFTLNSHSRQSQLCSKAEAEHDQARRCIRVVIAANGPYLAPLLASMHSIQETSSRGVQFSILIPAGESSLFYRALWDVVGETGTLVDIVEFNDARVKPLIHVWEGTHMEVYTNTFNYARYYLPLLFPYINEMVYLDPDTIAHVDLSILWDLFTKRPNKQKYPLAAVAAKPGKYGSICQMLNCGDEELSNIIFNKTHLYFNAGVFITDLSLWRSDDITGKLEKWMTINKSRRLWRWGSQGPLGLVFYDRWMELDAGWNERNVRKLGFNDTRAHAHLFETHPSIANAKIFHFTTEIKPWKPIGNQVIWDLWCPHYPRRKSLWFCRSGELQTLLPTSSLDYTFVKYLEFNSKVNDEPDEPPSAAEPNDNNNNKDKDKEKDKK